jgi:hypothetical protein
MYVAACNTTVKTTEKGRHRERETAIVQNSVYRRKTVATSNTSPVGLQFPPLRS